MKQIALDIGLRPVPSFANFQPGPNAAALQQTRDWVTLRSAEPLYLWGESGSGKTHLLQAARKALTLQGLDAGWLDAGTTAPPPFDDRWVAVFMDDVHLYDEAQQHTAFNWFVGAKAIGAGVLAAGDAPPADLKLREDLRNRLGWGQVYGLKALSEDECRAVLKQAAQERGVALNGEVMAFMLTRFSRDLGSLMQLLDHLDRYALQTQRAITVPLLKAMLEET